MAKSKNHTNHNQNKVRRSCNLASSSGGRVFEDG
jgi:hypothetical protein